MRKLLISLAAVILMVPAVFSQNAGDTESLVSADLNAFAKTSEITRLLKTVNYTVNTLMDEQTRSQILMQRDAFKDKTGIDYLNEASLKNNGIDTSRPLSMAFFRDDNYRDVFILFVPVFNEKEFPQKFNEIRKKNMADTGNYTVPLKSVYKGITVYQHGEDVFTTAFNGFFIMGSTSEVVQKAVDLKSANTDSLILDNNYKDYLAGVNRNNDINVYFSSKSLASLNTPAEQDAYNTDQGAAADENEMLKAVKYISMGAGLDGRIIKMSSLIRITRGNPEVDLFLDLLQTGIQKRTLNVASSDVTMALGLDFTVLEKFCRDGNPECAGYTSYKDQFKQTTGIDFEKEFLPNYSGVVNAIMTDAGAAGGMGEMAVFLPMLDVKKTEVIWNKLKKTSKDMYGPQKMFGEDKVDGKKAFWIMDASQLKYYVVFDSKGLYAGNSKKLIGAAMKSGTLDKTKSPGSVSRMVNDNTVMFINVKKTSILNQMLGMFMGNPVLGEIFAGISEITLKSDKNADGVTFDMEVELKGK
ncbi:MAG TPA: DUF3352 domain-containing protein [Spirochaetota bacterium]|nr:DUF3352 domain-containing protein [Spirochaetota bacterium]